MSIRVAINGFGRIGRLVFRIMMARPDCFEVVAVNDLTDNRTLASLLKYDSTHRRYQGDVDYNENALIVNGHSLKALAERNPGDLPWGELRASMSSSKVRGSLPPVRPTASLATTPTSSLGQKKLCFPSLLRTEPI